MKKIEILVLKNFSIIYEKSMIEKWCEILVTHRQWKGEKIFMQAKT